MERWRVIEYHRVWYQSGSVEMPDAPDEYKEPEKFEEWISDLYKKAEDTKQKIVQDDYEDSEIEPV